MINKKKLIHKNIQPIKPKQFYLYFLFNENEIVYIGETNKINQRISNHKSSRKYWLNSYDVKPYKEWTHYRFITSSSSKQVKKWEKRLIRFYNPKYNIGHNCNSLYEKKINSKKIKGKTMYYYEYIRNKNIRPKYIKTKNGLKWINFNPFTERTIYRDKDWYAYNRFLPSLKNKYLSNITSKNWKTYPELYNVRKLEI